MCLNSEHCRWHVWIIKQCYHDKTELRMRPQLRFSCICASHTSEVKVQSGRSCRRTPERLARFGSYLVVWKTKQRTRGQTNRNIVLTFLLWLSRNLEKISNFAFIIRSKSDNDRIKYKDIRREPRTFENILVGYRLWSALRCYDGVLFF